MIRRDSSGKEYAEVETNSDEVIRLTLVPAEEAGYRTNSCGSRSASRMGSSALDQAGRALGAISTFDHIHGRPLVTAIAVWRDSGFPSAGFYQRARDHDAGQFGRCDTPILLPGEDELAFVVRQRKAVEYLWQR